ncbi:head GIN domain-containing protein [Robiginitalea aurantiaca]|uniref:Head GIN domain-containing protein n=1 Tax=Robiginitalea aurantiaca TaxID=3056915 RepID=A0ABT7WAB8_9FLAO|nr:head GIN domain-containing protein [Robiginitalea aurantiaca]MDM9629862.1 head GIN domain-containing protein [Robiginitalea aurantiaca]
MHRNVFILWLSLLGLLQQNARAQDKTVNQTLTSFSEIKAFDGVSVNLISSDKNEAVIRGANVNDVAILVTDGSLKIRMKVTKIFSGYRTFVDVYYKQPIAVIDVNEDARIISEGTIKQEVLEVKAQEGGEIQVRAEVTQFLVKAVTGGVIKAEGNSKNQDVQINTGGSYRGKAFKTGFCTVNVNAGSLAEIFASDYVKATVKAGGEVLVYGDPSKMDEKTVFGGSIKRM